MTFHLSGPKGICIISAAILGIAAAIHATGESRQDRAVPAIVGRWDLTVSGADGPYPSWLEVTKSGHKTLVGRLVARFGSARPIGQVHLDGSDGFHFVLPVQWEAQTGEIKLSGRVADDRLEGTEIDNNGKSLPFTGVRAPSLIHGEPQWGDPIELFNSNDLTGWHKRLVNKTNGWIVSDGLLRNARPGNDLVTDRKFTDFKVHAEFRYPSGSNSGIYLRGRYEAQIEDNHGVPPDSHIIGGIYGFLQPRTNAARPAGEWQSYEITLVGRMVTVVLNGETVIDRQEIPGITGGAMDSDEAAPGPLLLQGDHGPIDFRKVTIFPSK